MAQLSEPIIEGSSGWSNLSALVKAIAVMVSLGLVASAAYVAVDTVSLYGNGIPVVQPPSGSARVPADDPGGTLVKNQGFSVNEIAGSGGAKPAPRRIYLAPPPQELADEDMGRAPPVDAAPPATASLFAAQPTESESGVSAPASPAASAAALDQAVSEALGVPESAAAPVVAEALPDAAPAAATEAGGAEAQSAAGNADQAASAASAADFPARAATAAAVADAQDPVATARETVAAASDPAQESPAGAAAALDGDKDLSAPQAGGGAHKAMASADGESQLAAAAAEAESRRVAASGGADAPARADPHVAALPADGARQDPAAPAADSPQMAAAERESPNPLAPAQEDPQRLAAVAEETAPSAAAVDEESRTAPVADARRAIRPQLRPAGLAARAAAAQAASAGAAMVRLGTFSTRDAALIEWSRIADGIPGGVSSRTRLVERASIAGQEVHRLRASGFASLAEARRFCASIAVRNADCSAHAAN